MQAKAISKNELRKRRHARVRGRTHGTRTRPRLAIYRSNRFVSAQVIDDEAGRTLAAAHGREFPGAAGAGAQARSVGEAVATRAKAAGIDTVVFDRGGYGYGAQVKALADAARAGGLRF